jgi:hypothetical protein
VRVSPELSHQNVRTLFDEGRRRESECLTDKHKADSQATSNKKFRDMLCAITPGNMDQEDPETA